MKNYEDLGIVDGVEIWKKYADKDGFISKDPEEIFNDIEDYDERKYMEELLYRTMYFYNIEWEDETEKRWKFKGDDM